MKRLAALGVAIVLSGCGAAGSRGLDTLSPSGSASSTAAATPSPDASPTGIQSPGGEVSRLQDAVQSALQTQTQAQVEGGDVSWPQCPPGVGIPQKQGKGAPMPLPSARFVVIGLTNGPGFHPNPCLADQVAWAKSHHLQIGVYAVVSTEPASAAPGREQALFNLRTMRAAGLDASAIWVDVENVPDFDWPADTAANATVVRGVVRTYQQHGLRVGVYSTPSLWRRVVGGLRLGLPEWRAAGQTSAQEAVRRCGAATSFQGGSAVLTQWVDAGRDRDLTCPGSAGSLPLWFHQY